MPITASPAVWFVDATRLPVPDGKWEDRKPALDKQKAAYKEAYEKVEAVAGKRWTRRSFKTKAAAERWAKGVTAKTGVAITINEGFYLSF